VSEAGDRAKAALRRASLVAAGEAPGPKVGASVEEYGSLEPAEARDEVESVLMGRFADRGLEALREENALEALVPEVLALVGFG
jgi:tRNA nucleotidyltransferase/poly(A) polymerase